jgi:hypothetical protein
VAREGRRRTPNPAAMDASDTVLACVYRGRVACCATSLLPPPRPPPWPVLALAGSGKHKRSPLPVIEVCRLRPSSPLQPICLSVRSLLARRHASVSLARTCHPKSTRPGAELRGHRQALSLSLSLSHSLSSPWNPSSSPMPSSHGPFQRSPDAYAVPAYDAMYAAAILYACVVRR